MGFLWWDLIPPHRHPLFLSCLLLVPMNNLSILIWNVRGHNDPHKKVSLRSVVNCVKPFVVCVQETKLNSVTHWDVVTCLF
jgi:hypothetical protein